MSSCVNVMSSLRKVIEKKLQPQLEQLEELPLKVQPTLQNLSSRIFIESSAKVLALGDVPQTRRALKLAEVTCRF